MPFPTAVASDASVDGVASIDTSGWHANALQVSVHNVTTGTGTVTIQVKPAGVDEWQAVIGATVDLTDATAPRTFTLEGRYDSVSAGSDAATDVFTLTAGA